MKKVNIIFLTGALIATFLNIGCAQNEQGVNPSPQASLKNDSFSSIQSYCSNLNNIGSRANDENQISGCWVVVSESLNGKNYLNYGNLSKDNVNINKYNALLDEGGYLIDTENYDIYNCKINLTSKEKNGVKSEMYSGVNKKFIHFVYSHLNHKLSYNKNFMTIKDSGVELKLKRDDGTQFEYLNTLSQKEAQLYNTVLNKNQCAFPSKPIHAANKQTVSDFIISLNSMFRRVY